MGIELRRAMTKMRVGQNMLRAPLNFFAVAGGVPASAMEFPFLSVFYHNATWRPGCAGALISPRHVITCWHCCQEKVSKNTEVGFYKLDRDSDAYVLKTQVQRFVFHPTLDVAILVLKRTVYTGIKPIRLPEDDGCDYNGQIITLVGPGGTGLPGSANTPESVFMKVDLEAYTGNGTSPNTGKKCINWEGREFVCATSLKKEPWGSGGSGDSGSPMIICRDGHGGQEAQKSEKLRSPRDCTIVGVLTGGTGANFKSDSAGPCVSGLRPWIDVVMKETAGEEWSLGGETSTPTPTPTPTPNTDTNNGQYGRMRTKSERSSADTEQR